MIRSSDRESGIPDPDDTRDETYTQRLIALRRRMPVLSDVRQVPYAWNVRRHLVGTTLEVGCGIGRNLHNLRGNAVGVDHNAASIDVARSRGFEAFTVDEFKETPYARPGAFDGLLIAHVLEHIDKDGCLSILRTYVPYVRPGGTVMLICPQEKGFDAEVTHIHWVDLDVMAELADKVGLEPLASYSFPLPRRAGKYFVHNEFCATFRVQGDAPR